MVSGFESNNKSQLNEIDHWSLLKFEQNISKDTPHKLILWVEPVSVWCQIAQTNRECLFRQSVYEWIIYN